MLAKQWLPSASIRECVIFMSLRCLRKAFNQESQILKCSRLCTTGSINRQNYTIQAYITSFTEGRMSRTEVNILDLMFIGPCIIIYFYSKTNQMHQFLTFVYFWITLYMFRTVFPSIIRSSKTVDTATGICQTEITGMGKITSECVYRLAVFLCRFCYTRGGW
jgi:hypothetical protein